MAVVVVIVVHAAVGGGGVTVAIIVVHACVHGWGLWSVLSPSMTLVVVVVRIDVLVSHHHQCHSIVLSLSRLWMWGGHESLMQGRELVKQKNTEKLTLGR